MTPKKIEVESEFASVIQVYLVGNIVSVDIDGVIAVEDGGWFASGLPVPVRTIWEKDLQGNSYTVSTSGRLGVSRNTSVNGWANLHFAYIAK